VEGNQNELVQVISNLIVNACQATQSGGKIKIESSKNHGALQIKVIDTGKGIKKTDLSHIFESFFSTKGEKGNGLGLSVSKQIIERHHGNIEVASKVGAGTCFTINLPLAKNVHS